MPAARTITRRERAVAGLRKAVRRVTPRHLVTVNVIVWIAVAILWQRCGLSGCPTTERLASYQPGGATILLDRHGNEFADLSPIEHDLVALDALPAYVPAAFVAVEDERFYGHHGVDARRVFGALLANIRARAFVQGFSTITMQLARNVWPETLPRHERTLQRKLLEVRIAREIESRFTKAEILELYLNHIYFGSGAYGIDAAALNYFGKPAAELRLEEAALLAAMPRSPTLYNPRRYPERARDRRDVVLSMMAEQERIDAAAARRARALPVNVLRDPPARPARRETVAPYFAEAVRRVLEDRLGETIYTTRLQVHTTLDLRVQRIAETELRRQLEAIENGRYGAFDDEHHRADNGEPMSLQGAVVVLEASSGDVLALVGGRDYAQSRFDRATRARRRAGSAFQPFVYATAIAQGFAPSQLIEDDTLRMELDDGAVWEPQNYLGEFHGFISLREALTGALAVPTIRLAQDVGLDNIERLARDAGVESDIPDAPAAAMGVAHVTVLELTAAYTAFANRGIAAEPRLVTRAVDSLGVTIWANQVETEPVLEPDVAWLMTDMLRDAATTGTGSAVREAGFRSAAAGQTGTTHDGADAWFIGYTPDLVAGVRLGFDTPRAIVERATGGRLAAPVWARVMRGIYEQRPTPAEWSRPEGVVERTIDPSTGLVLLDGCSPVDGEAGTELFVAGDVPAASCPAGTPTEDTRGARARLGDWLERAWRRSTHFVARHFGSEEAQPIPPRGEERYLGTARLPRAVEIADPVVAADSFRPPPAPRPSADSTAVSDSAGTEGPAGEPDSAGATDTRALRDTTP